LASISVLGASISPARLPHWLAALSALLLRQDGIVAATRTSGAWQRYAWVAGIVFVLAFVAETVVSIGVGVNQNDSAVKIANALHEHRGRLLVVAYLSVIYAAMFLIYLSKLHELLRGDAVRRRFPGSLVLAGGALFVALHAVSDIGITGLLGAKLASFGLVLDLIGLVLFLIFVLVSSVILLTRQDALPTPGR
jgi:hypothetical protein